MTKDQAKEILLAYRPGVDDAQDPEVVAALALCRADATLEAWFQEQQARQEAVRAKFRELRAPSGLSQQILSEQRAQLTLPLPFQRRRMMVGALACLVIGLAVVFLWQTTRFRSGEDLSFNGYRQRMVKTALRAYGMDLETNDVAQVRAFLAEKKAPADFVLPAALAQMPPVGCGVLAWQGRPVTMICFRTGKPLEPGIKSDLYLFVIEGRNLQDEVNMADKPIVPVSQLITASWRAGDKVYLLAAFTADDLKQRL